MITCSLLCSKQKLPITILKKVRAIVKGEWCRIIGTLSVTNDHYTSLSRQILPVWQQGTNCEPVVKHQHIEQRKYFWNCRLERFPYFQTLDVFDTFVYENHGVLYHILLFISLAVYSFCMLTTLHACIHLFWTYRLFQFRSIACYATFTFIWPY